MDKESAMYYLYDLESDMAMHIINEWNSNKGNPDARQNWKVIPATMLIKEWNYHAETGLVHESVIGKFEKICIDNYLKLYINTILFGHTQVHPYTYLETYLPEDDDWDEDKTDEWLEDFEWFACDEFGNWKISDYATDKIGDLVVNLIAEEDHSKKLFWIDQILSVVHQRSDIAKLFVEGGNATLGALAGEEL